MTASAIYRGDVVHVRHRPKRHRLRYRVFALLLDLEELSSLSARSRWFGYNRAAFFSFWDADHGDGRTGTLRAWVETQLHDAALDIPSPRIRVLCYPRILGYVFNPLTEYFCYDGSGVLRAVLHEVCNTHGERLTYVIPVAGPAGDRIRQQAPKRHFVSPFVPMECTYAFDITPPAERLRLSIAESDGDGPLLYASFAARRRPFTDRELRRLAFAYPLMTLKVTAAIHFEAVRLLLKGLRIHPHMPASASRARLIVRPDHAPRDRQPEPVRD